MFTLDRGGGGNATSSRVYKAPQLRRVSNKHRKNMYL